ncbi:PD-(D/E)XK nuclease family protein [Candidatus Pacearchaeota archaeon]|nr:PD-(D/E)XK nuclease family protein [Candidatus Pacearchaeota archaeon]
MIDFNKLIDNHLIKENKPREIGKYWPSEVGSCLRKVWYSYKIPKETDSNLLRIFESGNLLHEFIANVIKSEKNPDVELLKAEMPIKIEEKEFTVSGRVDNLVMLKINNEEVLVEVKSTKFLRNEPQESHVTQLQLYMHATGVQKGIVLYIQKDNLQTRWFNFTYDKKKAEKILARFKVLHETLKKDKIPEPEAKKCKELNWMCNYCHWKDECDEQEKGLNRFMK